MILARSFGRLAFIRSSSATTTPSSHQAALSTTSIKSSNTTTAATTTTTTESEKNNELISIKDSCLNRLKQILDKPKEEYLRVQVETGGCSGFSYLFVIENNTKLSSHEDLVFSRDQYRVVVNKDILPYIRGSAIEFSETLIKTSFQIINPIAETKCSCGSSFSIDLKKLSKS